MFCGFKGFGSRRMLELRLELMAFMFQGLHGARSLKASGLRVQGLGFWV